MKSLLDAEVKSLAATPGPAQYLAFGELARRIRNNPDWLQGEEPWAWSPVDVTRAPNAKEMEWAFLQWSEVFRRNRDPELGRVQDTRIRELQGVLSQDPDSLAMKYFDAIGDELSRREAHRMPAR